MFPLDPDLTLAKMTIWSHQKEKAKTQIVDAERKQQQKSKMYMIYQDRSDPNNGKITSKKGQCRKYTQHAK